MLNHSFIHQEYRWPRTKIETARVTIYYPVKSFSLERLYLSSTSRDKSMTALYIFKYLKKISFKLK